MKQTLEVPVKGMDCAECTQHVKKAIGKVQGVADVEVFLASEKAVVQLDPDLVKLADIRKAVEGAGYSIPEDEASAGGQFHRQVLTLLGIVFGFVLFVVVFGEWLGLFETITARVPLPIGIAIVLVFGYPVFKNVVRATLKGQVISHTLMTVGVLAALVIGEWATAAVIVFFMRVGDYAERFTTERARRAVKDLTAMAPQSARVERDEGEQDVPIEEVQIGETVVVRPGEKIPVDGEVISGQATIDQASITGESMPVTVGEGSQVFAATIAQFGSLRVRATGIGSDSTFGRVIKMVEAAEANRANVQQIADKFSAYYLPVVAGIAFLTYLFSRNPLATAAVLVVACSCSFALATPIAMLASIGAAARHGLLIKGGKYIEALDKADVLLIDKTGTLTLGKPEVTDVLPAGAPISYEAASIRFPDRPAQSNESEIEALLKLAASVERFSEHPVAEAIRQAARKRGLSFFDIQDFEALPGLGVRGRLDGEPVMIGSRRMIEDSLNSESEPSRLPEPLIEAAERFETQGKTILYVVQDGEACGLLAVADTLRPEVPGALAAVIQGGIKQLELLTGDNEATAASLVAAIQAQAQLPQLSFRANLLPQDKIAIVKDYQEKGHTVIMVGDGVNDAPALAQANVGIAMGTAGADIAIEAAHVALMRSDWTLVPEVLNIAHRTMRVVKLNIGFTGFYNLLGLSLAAFGFLPPILAAAAQSLPDLGILANSSRLLRQKR